MNRLRAVLAVAVAGIGHRRLLVALCYVWPGEVEVVTKHLVHGEDTLEERVGLWAVYVLRDGEGAMAGEVVGRGGQRGVEGERDVGHLHVGSKVWRGLHDAVVVVGVVHGGTRWRLCGRGHLRVFCGLA